MPRDIETRLYCERCKDTPYTVFRVPTRNEGVFVNEIEPDPPQEGEVRCPMCLGPLVRQ